MWLLYQEVGTQLQWSLEAQQKLINEVKKQPRVTAKDVKVSLEVAIVLIYSS